MLTLGKYKTDHKKRWIECWNENAARFGISGYRRRPRNLGNVKKGDWAYKDMHKVLREKTRLKKEIRLSGLSMLPGDFAIEDQFNKLAFQWRKETGGYSTTPQITRNGRYVDIIGMGMKVVPLILKDLQKEPDYWFVALSHIVKPDVDPIAKEHFGDLEKMTEDWLKWGKENKII